MTKGKSIKKVTGGDKNMLSINKTIQEKEMSRKKLHESYNQHVNKVQMRKQTLS